MFDFITKDLQKLVSARFGDIKLSPIIKPVKEVEEVHIYKNNRCIAVVNVVDNSFSVVCKKVLSAIEGAIK